MRFLLSCVNSPNSLIGYDWEKREIFWQCPQSKVRSCGICYDGADLLISTDNTVTRLTSTGFVRSELDGGFDALAHSVHPITESHVGVVDTGNSCVVVLNRNGEVADAFSPLEAWGPVPHDAIHLNDFVVTPYGILASCFDYRPWRKVKEEISWTNWCSGGYGLVLNLTGDGDKGAGRVVGCGFNHPHSLTYFSQYLYLCSSATGEFHRCEIDSGGSLREVFRHQVTTEHFLRGAHPTGDVWFLGGSSRRHGEIVANSMALYQFDEHTGKTEKQYLGGQGEIYDVLPWDEELLEPIIAKHFSH